MSTPLVHVGAIRERTEMRAKSAFGNSNAIEDKENQHPNLRSILKRQEHHNSTNKKSLSVKFTLPLTEREEKTLKMEKYINNAIETLLIIWAKQYARAQAKTRPIKYIDRVIFNFQPGMTPNYLEYLLHITTDSNPSNFSKRELALSLRKNFEIFLKTFPERKTRIRIFKDNVTEAIKDATKKDTKPSIFLVQCSDPYDEEFKLLIESFRRSEHCLVVFAEPIHGLRMYKLEDALKIKVRPLVLPRLTEKPKGHPQGSKYDFDLADYNECYGIPMLLEHFKKGQAKADTDEVNQLLLEHMALWLKPKYKEFTGYFFALFNMDSTQMSIASKTNLPSSSLKVVDGAAILGFDIEFETRSRKDSDGKEEQTDAIETQVTNSTPKKKEATRMPQLNNKFNFVVRAIPYLSGKFARKNPEFDAFTLLRSDNLKWLELEKAIARAMTNNIESKKLGERWTFLSNSFFKNEQSDLKLNPQVVPRVKRNGTKLVEEHVLTWTLGTRSSAPQATMQPSDWPLLFNNLELRRTILPVDKSRSPDCMFAFKDGLLCFQAKSGSQDLTMKEFREEIGKTPFLKLNTKDSIVRQSSEYEHVKITLVYLAQSHSIVKSKILAKFKNSDADTTHIDGITKEHGYIHVAYGNKVLPLPDQNVEIIILLRARITSLIGSEGYATLVDPLTEVKALGAQERDREKLQNRQKATRPDVKTLTKQLYEEVQDIDNALETMLQTVSELMVQRAEKKKNISQV